MKEKWLEHVILYSITIKKNTKLNCKIVGQLKESYFTQTLYKTAYKRILSLYNKKGRLLTWKELILDLSLDESVRRKLKANEIKRRKIRKHDPSVGIPKGFDEFDSLIGNLRIISTKVELIKLQNSLTEELKKKTKKDDIKDLVEKVTITIDKIKSIDSSSSKLFKMKKSDVKRRFKDFYAQLKDGFFLPTGFKGFDDINVGIPLDSFFLISGRSGTGKSSLAIQLAINMKLNGARVCIMPLEMSVEQNLIRIGANLSGISVTDIVKNLKTHYKPVIRKISKFIGDDDTDASCLHFYEPGIEETIDESLNILKNNNYDIIINDYINLQAPMGGDHQSQAHSLNLASRYAKRFASTNKTIVCFLAQLDDEEHRVRYARALVEDASNCWLWTQSLDEINELGYLTIIQKKARNQNPKTFNLKVDLATCKFTDHVSTDMSNSNTYTDKMSDGMDDIPNEDDV